MSFKSVSALGVAAAALCIALPAAAQTNTTPAHHRVHHSRAVVHGNSAEVGETRSLNRQQLAVAQSDGQTVSHSAGAAEPVARTMPQRVPGGNPLHSAAAGGGAHVSGPPPARN